MKDEGTNCHVELLIICVLEALEARTK